MAEKKPHEVLAEKLFIKKKYAGREYSESDIESFGKEYAQFLTENKTEREWVDSITALAEKNGFKNLAESNVETGGAYYFTDGRKNIALIRYNGLDQVRCVASHVDSPCLHLKPYPLTESQGFALFKGHWYGGIKKYQWLNIPLALHGVVIKQNGEKVHICVGEKEDEPVFTIPDLLPHLAREQMEKEARKLVEGEQLNPIIASVPYKGEDVSEPVKLAIAEYLYNEYGIIEEDLISSELIFVPAGKVREAGFDRALLVGYGHDDRSCSYASLRSMLDVSTVSTTSISAFYDKEEIGSEGKTGAQNLFFDRLLEELIDKTDHQERLNQVWERVKVFSADVTAGVDPNFSDVHDTSNAPFLGRGVAIEKYGAGGGKYHTNDADAEYVREVIKILNDANVPWQTGELGKLGIGGGGTIAMYLSKKGADVIDVGVPVLGMHAPYEVVSKSDMYIMYKAFRALFEAK